jgi:hypothetical protein
VGDREQCGARRVHAQRAGAETDQREAVRGEKGQLEVVPTTFWSDGEQDALVAPIGQHRVDRRSPARVGNEADAVAEQPIEMILDEDSELPVN